MKEMTGQEALKKLRDERQVWIEQAKSLIKEQSSIIKKIKEHLQGDGKTVPEIARATGIKSSEVLWFVMALKKYGQVLEGPKDGDYYKYELTNP
ncbi:MAG: winged helix-turn-helix domain-containing protein [Deltaproteobacteria bacterium]|nr:winged helix-turn-helix domain-containing protein [Deltaproteobacteria bacterium]